LAKIFIDDDTDINAQDLSVICEAAYIKSIKMFYKGSEEVFGNA